MSLNRRQLEQNAQELRANLERSGLSVAQVAQSLGVPPDRVQEALDGGEGDPVLVWHLRDALQAAVQATGQEPVPFTVLTEDQRAAARGRFGI